MEEATMYTFIYRHPSHQPGRWLAAEGIYETPEAAVEAACAVWDGTGVTWRLRSIPGVEVAWTGHYPKEG